MGNIIQGKVHSISNIIENQVNGKVYTKVYVTLNCTTYGNDGQEWKNFPQIEFFGDKGTSEAAQCSVGDEVKITYELKGKIYINKNGEQANFTKASGYKLEVVSKIETNQEDKTYTDKAPWDEEVKGVSDETVKTLHNNKQILDDDLGLPF